MDVCNDVAQVGFKELKVVLKVVIGLGICGVLLLLTFNHLFDLGFCRLDAGHYLLTLELLEGEDFVELALELLNKRSFIIVGPWFSIAGFARDVGFLQSILKLVVGDVMPVIVFDQGLTKLLTKSEGNRLVSRVIRRGIVGERGGCWSESTNFILVDRPSDQHMGVAGRDADLTDGKVYLDKMKIKGLRKDFVKMSKLRRKD